MVQRPLLALAAAALAASALSACGPTARTCVDWVVFDDAQGAFDEATLVVIGVADEADGSIELLPGPGELHRVDVERVLKGELAVEELRAAAPRDYCVAEPPQPADDPIPAGERVILFLHPASADPEAVRPDDLAEVEHWAGLTPQWTAIRLLEGEDVPFDTGG
ncbi:hypothetical protein H4J02_06075 [Protaetiibacter sp. SSC-01]|uniref:hypothetical protein n=1 Tax=Protaetiibacter sp. SSC-01 TaxID=2759943 RepID=UPI0016570E5E|nr:hypothetical protein [Protaetiibacter sp. SSC-01]QNO38564.1 hypothetical protein H4J02_06075 [Protaetiibacter sp. SSC-01]